MTSRQTFDHLGWAKRGRDWLTQNAEASYLFVHAELGSPKTADREPILELAVLRSHPHV